MMYASGLWHHTGKEREGSLANVIIPLMGRSKGETGSRHQP